jgi:hypothetical protein
MKWISDVMISVFFQPRKILMASSKPINSNAFLNWTKKMIKNCFCWSWNVIADECCGLKTSMRWDWMDGSWMWIQIQKTVPHPAVLIALTLHSRLWFKGRRQVPDWLLFTAISTASVAMCSLFCWVRDWYKMNMLAVAVVTVSECQGTNEP